MKNFTRRKFLEIAGIGGACLAITPQILEAKPILLIKEEHFTFDKFNFISSEQDHTNQVGTAVGILME